MTPRDGSEAEVAYTCRTCGFELWVPIARLGVSTLGLYDDARFPGRCLLVLDEHVDDFAEVPRGLREEFMDDVQLAARTIASAVSADRINYAVLGNAIEHVHFHLIPRDRSFDPVPTRAPWAHPEPATSLGAERRSDLVGVIRGRLSRRA